MTAQVKEKLTYEGEAMSMAFCPPIPQEHPRIKTYELIELEHKDIDGFIFSTACWRRYIGTWEIKDDQFYLVSVEGIYEVVGKEPILADWFTGVLRIPKGQRLQYVHMGFGSVYEEEIHVKIEAGKVVKKRTIDNRNKDVNAGQLGWNNLPGGENKFDGDDW
jgi:hypothetical protein